MNLANSLKIAIRIVFFDILWKSIQKCIILEKIGKGEDIIEILGGG